VGDLEPLEDREQLGVAEALGQRAGVAGALAQLVLEREVAEQRPCRVCTWLTWVWTNAPALPSAAPTTSGTPPTCRTASASSWPRSTAFSRLAASSSATAVLAAWVRRTVAMVCSKAVSRSRFCSSERSMSFVTA
jgi:hypothetical protein